MLKKIIVTALAFVVLSASAAKADDMVQEVLTDSLYGGVIGALLGGAVLLLADNPDDHLDYIAKGAGAGILLGATYGIVAHTTGFAIGEVDEHGKFALKMPTIKSTQSYDKNAQTTEMMSSLDVLKVKF